MSAGAVTGYAADREDETNTMRQTRRVLPWVLLGCLLASAPAVRAANFTTGTDTAVKFGVHEISLTGDGSVANPFDTLATVQFVPPSGAKNAKTVYAFYDGDNTWRARVYVSETGAWSWSSACATDKGLDGNTGTFKSADSKLRGRLLPHPKNPRHWITENGRWFLNVVDTACFLLSPKDEAGQLIPDEDFLAYVRDAVNHGVTSFMASAVLGSASVAEEGNWTETYFADAGFTRLRLDNLRLRVLHTRRDRCPHVRQQPPHQLFQLLTVSPCHPSQPQVSRPFW